MQDVSDHELLRLTMDGDAGAFTALYRRRQAGVYRYALQMSGAASTAEDVVQDTFLTLICDGGSYDPARGSVAAFLYGIARNHVLRRLDRRRLAGEEEAAGAVAADHPESELARSETVARVRAAVLALPVHYREAVVLCDLEELDHAEAAAALGCAVGTVKSRLHRARQMLAERLQAPAARCSL
ncbi:MAG: RNA polymerase sigma factor [Acidobacteriota bacterium]